MREPAILSRRALAALPIAALAGAAPAAASAALAPAASAGDAVLLDLGRRWQAALEAELAHGRTWTDTLTGAEAAEHEAIGDDLHDAVGELFEAIIPLPATTAAGLAVKARILAYENDVERLDEAGIAAALGATRYLVDRAALSLALDILRLAGAAS